MAAFGFCVFTPANCSSSLLRTLQPQLLLTGIDHDARLPVSPSYSNVTLKDLVGRCVRPAFYLGNSLCRHVEHLFVSIDFEADTSMRDD